MCLLGGRLRFRVIRDHWVPCSGFGSPAGSFPQKERLVWTRTRDGQNRGSGWGSASSRVRRGRPLCRHQASLIHSSRSNSLIGRRLIGRPVITDSTATSQLQYSKSPNIALILCPPLIRSSPPQTIAVESIQRIATPTHPFCCAKARSGPPATPKDKGPL